MPYIHYQYDPNDPEGREKARFRAIWLYFALMFSFCCLMLAVISYLTALSTALKSGTYDDCISSFLLCRHSILCHSYGRNKSGKKAGDQRLLFEAHRHPARPERPLCHESILFPFLSWAKRMAPSPGLRPANGHCDSGVRCPVPAAERAACFPAPVPPRRKRLSWPSPQSQNPLPRNPAFSVINAGKSCPAIVRFAAPAAQSSKCKRCLSMPKKYREPLPARW